MTESRPIAGCRRLVMWGAAVFILAAGLRVGWVLHRWGPAGRDETLDYPDEEAYVLAGKSLAAGHGLIDEFGYRATYMPGYPAFLAIFQGLERPLLWARMAQAILAAAVAPAAFVLARRFLSDETIFAPVLAGLAAACDPFLVFFSGLLLTEALFAAVLVATWVCVLNGERGSWAKIGGAGILMWMAVMLRPSAAVLVVLTPLAMIVRGRFRPTAIMRAAMIPVVVVILLAPWALRNYAVIGQWCWLTTRGGISLYDGLQPGATGESDLAHTKTMAAVRNMTEVEWDAHFRAAAWAGARRDPAGTLRLAERKFLRTWSLIPNVAEYHGGATAKISAAWMTMMLGLAAVGFWQSRRRVAAWMMLLLPVVAFTALHMVYVGSVRYRVPLMPLVMVLSAVGAAGMLKPARSAKITREQSH